MTVKFWEAISAIYVGNLRLEVAKPEYNTLKLLIERMIETG